MQLNNIKCDRSYRDQATIHHCSLCGSSNHSLLFDKGRHNQVVHNYICNNCGFVFVLPRPSAKKHQDLYQEDQFFNTETNLSAPDDAKFAACELVAQSRLKILERELGEFLWSKETSKSILEVGCGTGDFLRLMRGCGWNVLGLEPDVNYTEAVKKRYNLSIDNQFVEQFYTEKRFNLICSFDVIEHIEEPNVFLANIYRLLDDQGYLYLECPSIDRWYGETIDFFFRDVHINTFSQKTLKAFLAKNQFQLISSGWNSHGLWVIAQKTNKKNLLVEWDDPQRIHQIIQQASFPIKAAKNNRLITRTSSIITRSINLIKTKPLQIPIKVSNKIKNRFHFDSAFNTSGDRLLNAEEVAIKPSLPNTSSLRVVHVGIHQNTDNGGDTLLFPAIRWLWQNHLAPTHFTLSPLRGEVTQKTIDEINQHDALIIGGGGLFLSDTNPNGFSGWQWACSTELLDKIKVPIILFAVGYNQFRGQSKFKPVFTENLRKLVEKSAFIGLRNYGSIEALKQYLPEYLHHKLIFQPCPTTLLSRFYPDIPFQTENTEKIVSVNIAFDRHHLRFGHREDEILWNIADSLLLLQEKGWKPVLFNHSSHDRDAYLWFKARGLRLDEARLFCVPPQTVIQEYSQVSLALGMRGHAQMIPFGLNCPILSLITHDKLGFFLDDIGHNEWGIDLQQENVKNNLTAKINYFINHQNDVNLQLQQAQEKLWQITQQNIEKIKKSL
ncbi:Methyltransferase type 12 [Stanieria cyanosphaera PCC 7437]|uniref:Methyltransferase type 12 n=1 Tax=Stanieria cyanosphaera (strain ATCC 29371 / PCC 7437) TaxID=111780 RepID=K9XUC4_STAC7|nr:methyltransferase domain-containing protein [Stanieria cyanosphaera]AFZ36133.1 Methyltransferase type 12 [Stanieria cyanosphaera PCC 7437]